MARTLKIDNLLLKRLRLKEENEKRKFQIRVQREKFLIVCEGLKTEPNYFKAIEKQLPKGIVFLNVQGIGANTLSVVEFAIKERDNKQGTLDEYDQVWVVFDKDDFPDQNFNNAVFLSADQNINCAFSNEAFELWYVLHFQFLDVALKRQQYFEILSDLLGFEYEKNTPNIFEILKEKGSQANAINWAKKLDKSFKNSSPSNEKPNTKVYKLVEVLNQFLK